MGMTITEKNMARHAGLDVVKPGQIIECHLDAVLMNDITFPPARKEFLKNGYRARYFTRKRSYRSWGNDDWC